MLFRKPLAPVATFTTAVTLILISLIFLTLSYYVKPAFSDGLFQDQLSASIGERKVGLFIKMTPPVVTTETLKKGQNPTVEFRIFNSSNNGTYFHVTYHISIEKGGQTLLNEWLHHHYGDLKLEINPKNTTRTTIYAQKDPVLDMYTGTLDTPVVIEGLIFLEGGLYHFKVRVLTLDEDTLVLPADQQTAYEDSLSIGNSENKTMSIGDKQVPVNIISYYDKLKDFRFDNKLMQMQFDMPFDWNISRLNKANIFVHQEITTPRSNDFAAKRSYSATVNGINIPKSVMLDNSNSKNDVIHIMLSKNQIIQVADQLSKNGQANKGLMKFVLKAGSNSTEPMTSSSSMQSMNAGSMASMSSNKSKS